LVYVKWSLDYLIVLALVILGVIIIHL
jgi:hypothetical protein